MSKYTKWLYLSSIFLILFTIVKEVPPYRIYLFDFMFIPCLFFIVLQRLNGTGRTAFLWQRIDTMVVTLLVPITIAFVFSEDRAQSVVGYLDWIRIVVFYFISRMVFFRIVTELSWQRLLWIAAIVLLVIGMIQIITGTSFGLIGNYFGAGLDQGSSANVKGFDSRARVSGTTSNPIIFAMWVTMFTLFVISDLNAKKRHILFVCFSILSAIVVLSTLSRGAIAAFVLSLLILLYLNRQEFAKVIVVSMLFITLIVPLAYLGILKHNIGGAVTMLQARVENNALLEEDSDRFKLIEMGFSLLSEPKVFLVGTGPGNTLYAYNKYITGAKVMNYGNIKYGRSGIHNIWMKMFVEYGVISVVIFVFIWIDVFRRTIKLWKNKYTDKPEQKFGGFVLAFIVPYLLIDCNVYESAMSYHILIPIFSVLAYLVTKTENIRKIMDVSEPVEEKPGQNHRVFLRRR